MHLGTHVPHQGQQSYIPDEAVAPTALVDSQDQLPCPLILIDQLINQLVD